MTDPVSAVNLQTATPMAMQDLPQPLQGGFAPELGKELFDSVAKMQESYRAEAARADGAQSSDSPVPGPAVQDVGPSDPLVQFTQSMDHSIRMQAELAEFVMVSSVSSAFGRNLNSFLRGQ
ncbi:MAG: hypothetical protein AAFR17_09160 [Pseudomonadota bacterium]